MMTAAVVAAGIVPPRPAWQSLLWIAPLTLLWILLIYWLPAISANGVPTTAVRLLMGSSGSVCGSASKAPT